MAKEPTQKQRAVFDFVCEAIRREGRPPTVREVADHFGYASPKAASDHLAALERKGYLSRPERKSRNIHSAEGLDPRGIPVVRDIEPETPVLTLGKVEESLSLNTLFEVDQKTVAVRMKDDSMKDTMIGVDLAKRVFHLHVASMTGEGRDRKKLTPAQFRRYMSDVPG